MTSPTIEELEDAMKSCDGPMHALAFFPIWKLYKYIKKEGITVTLDGQGPDEMLGGYRPIEDALWTAIELQKPWWFYDIYRTYAAQGETAHFSSKKFAKRITLEIIKFTPKIIIKTLLRRIGLYNKPDLLQKSKGEFKNLLDKSLYNQFFNTPLPGILNQYDRCSMAHGVECRMPFMDYNIVEFIFSLPPESKVGNGYTKYVLREAMKGILPDETRLNKKKIGFNAPIVDWFKGNLREWMLSQMEKSSFQECEYFNGRELLSKFNNFLQNPNAQWGEAWSFWPPIHIAWWLEFIKTEKFTAK
jgi:asparagine synthase (glutamine-hydrolysing)